MSNVDELQVRRDELMEKIVSVGPYNNVERGANFSELKRLTDEMLDAMRYGQPNQRISELEKDVSQRLEALAEQVDRRVTETENELARQDARITLLRDTVKALERNKVNAWADKTGELERRVKQLRAWADDVDSAVSELYKRHVSPSEAIEEDSINGADILKRILQRTSADTDADEAKPAPCPYCGSDIIVVSESTTQLARWAVACKGCGARGPMCQSTVVAKAKWNGVAGGTPADSVPAAPVRALNDAAAAAFDVIDSAVEDGYLDGETIATDDWAGLRDKLSETGRDVDNALARLSE